MSGPVTYRLDQSVAFITMDHGKAGIRAGIDGMAAEFGL